MENGGGAAAVPTGCYKCGRPGHWSRDCPSNPNPNSNSNSNVPPTSDSNAGNSSYPKPTSYNPKSTATAAAKPKKAPRTRPKLTPDLLLSNDGLGYILRHFPRAFKYRGRGHEVSDLRHLLGLYADWHSRLIPYYSFDQFIDKVEQVGTTRRVKVCISQLREAVASGIDPAKLHELKVELENSSHDQVADAQGASEVPTFVDEDPIQNNQDPDDLQEDMSHEVLENVIGEPFQPSPADTSSGGKEGPNKSLERKASSCNQIQMSEEQKARMEANRLKALERAAARARS